MNEIIALCPKSVDLTNSEHLELIKKIVDRILERYSLQEILREETALIEKRDKTLVFILLVLKLAKSKIVFNRNQSPLAISVVFAVYKEHARIRQKREHPHGEDFLRRKVLQLEWLFENRPNVSWELIVVDDGCPENSGKIAQRIVDKNDLGDRVKVLFLQDAIDQNLPIAKNLSSTNDSQKGAAIIYGMWHSIQNTSDEDRIIIYTDADLSTHIGQVGLLIDPLLNQDKSAAIGSRREPESIVIKQGTRNDRGKLFIYLWKRLIPNLGDVIDTQCGFKAFRNEAAAAIIDDLIETKFAFDIELLLKTELLQNNSISKVPIAWIDSEEASTTTDLRPYLPMLRSIVKMYKKYLPSNPTADEFAAFIESLDEISFNRIIDNIPQAILEREPYEFTDFDGVSVADLIP